MGITTWMYLGLSICVLFTSLMQLVNGTQFLNTIALPLLRIYIYMYTDHVIRALNTTVEQKLRI